MFWPAGQNKTFTIIMDMASDRNKNIDTLIYWHPDTSSLKLKE